MATEIKAPTFPESVAEGSVAAWHKKPGDSVERDELIVEIETDKVVLEVLAPEAGTLSEVLAEEGDTVESEQVLGRIGEGKAQGGDKPKSEKADAKAESKGDAKAEKKASGGGKQHEVKAPTFPESIQEGTVASWNKQVGEAVKRDEVLAEIETDKVVLEVVAPADGALAEIKAEEGSQVESEAVLAIFTEGAGGEADTSADEAPAASADDGASDEKVGDKILAPAARKLVAEHDLDVSRIEGTGKGGRILKEDVQKAVKEGTAKKAAKPAGGAAKAAAAAPAVEGERPEKRVPMSRLRQTIAKRLVRPSRPPPCSPPTTRWTWAR
jgi:2-oxoglutarate dehydrogenase E2 component (dihydrolipoamide succinyltransferase)